MEPVKLLIGIFVLLAVYGNWGVLYILVVAWKDMTFQKEFLNLREKITFDDVTEANFDAIEALFAYIKCYNENQAKVMTLWNVFLRRFHPVNKYLKKKTDSPLDTLLRIRLENRIKVLKQAKTDLGDQEILAKQKNKDQELYKIAILKREIEIQLEVLQDINNISTRNIFKRIRLYTNEIPKTTPIVAPPK